MINDLSEHAVISTSGATFYDYANLADLETSVIVGLSPTNYHTFLLCKNIEYHPSLSIREARLLKRKNSVVRACVFIHFYNLEKAQVDAINQRIYEQIREKTGSCHMGVYKILQDTIGLELTSKSLKYSPSKIFEELSKTSKIKINGKLTSDFSLCLVRKMKIGDLIKDIRKYERFFFPGYLISYFMLAIFNIFKVKGKYKVSTELRTLIKNIN